MDGRALLYIPSKNNHACWIAHRFLYHKDGGNMFHQNVDNHLPDFTLSQPKRPQTTLSIHVSDTKQCYSVHKMNNIKWVYMQVYIQTSIKSIQWWHKAHMFKEKLDESERRSVQWKSILTETAFVSNMVLQNCQRTDKDIKQISIIKFCTKN